MIGTFETYLVTVAAVAVLVLGEPVTVLVTVAPVTVTLAVEPGTVTVVGLMPAQEHAEAYRVPGQDEAAYAGIVLTETSRFAGRVTVVLPSLVTVVT